MKINFATILALCLLCFAGFEAHANQQDALDHLRELKRSASINTDFEDEVELIDETKVVLSHEGLKENDKIEKLPGQPNDDVGFDQYGGYITVNEKSGRAFYYYFVEAEHSKESKPLLLWLNGGPGCSSLGYGAMTELGPFGVSSDGKTLLQNPYAWNKVANVLFLESPAGVRFSYTNTTSDFKLNGDKLTAHDNYVFLVNWLKRFPEYKNRDFYISGESYAGHYVPQLAHNILHHNKHNQNTNKTIINLKGIIIGNAVINDGTDDLGMYDYFWTHGLISDEQIHNIHKHCNPSIPKDWSSKNECVSATDRADNYTFYRKIDIYNLYAPICIDGNLTAEPRQPPQMMDPCSEYYVYAYLNIPEVQKAMHANVTGISYDWEPCSSREWLKQYQDGASTVLPLLREFLDNGLRVWVYSGDIDGRVPLTSTRYSLNKMNLPIRAKWYPWDFKGEVGGYTFRYQGGLTFATVRGAGHEVPGYQPQRALSLIKHFLLGKSLHVSHWQGQ